jgi:hypothetical protein
MSRQHRSERAEQAVGRMRARIADHKRGLNRMTVQGFPTQSATDALSKLCVELALLGSARNGCGMEFGSGFNKSVAENGSHSSGSL